MDADARRLDGNAVAGMLGQIFPLEMSMVETGCSACGRREPLGAELVYADGPGVVMRCLHCESVLLTLVHDSERYWLNMPAVLCLHMTDNQQAP